MNIKQLRQDKADLTRDASAYLDKTEELDEGDEKEALFTKHSETMDKIDAVNANIKRYDRQRDAELSLDTVGSSDDDADASVITGGDINLRPFANIGEMAVAVRNATMGTGLDQRLAPQATVSGGGTTVNSDGGFLVQQDLASEMIKRIHDQGDILSRVRKIPISSPSNGLTINAVDETSRADGSRIGGIRGYWLEEGGDVTKSKPEFRQMNLKLKKIAALVYATEELLADTSAFAALIREEVPNELVFKVEDAIVNGDGAGKPKGFNLTGGNSAMVTVAKETGQSANTIVVENIVKIFSRMYARSIRNSVWLINQDVQPQLFTMGVTVGTGGVPVYLPPGGISGSPFASLMGRPIIMSEYSETLGTAGDIMFVDLSQYLMVDKGGIRSDSSMHVRFLNDEETFRFIYRVDGQPIWNSALTPFKGTNTVSPFVRLATRS